VRVNASVPSQKLVYGIRGELTARFERDATTGDTVGTIPVLHLLVQGKTEQEAKEQLGRMFEEFCDVEFELGGVTHLLDTLIKRGFLVFDKTQHNRTQDWTEHLEIAPVPGLESGSTREESASTRTYVAEKQPELAGV